MFDDGGDYWERTDGTGQGESSLILQQPHDGEGDVSGAPSVHSTASAEMNPGGGPQITICVPSELAQPPGTPRCNGKAEELIKEAGFLPSLQLWEAISDSEGEKLTAPASPAVVELPEAARGQD